MKCTRCKRREVVYKCPYSHEELCISCLAERMINRVKRAISRFKMFTPRDHIMLVIEGSRKEIAMVDLLSKIEKEYPQAKLSILLVEKGLTEDKVGNVLEFIKGELGLEVIYRSFREVYGHDLKEIYTKLAKKNIDCTYICSVCRSLEYRLIQKEALKNNATKIALSILANEIAADILNHLLQGRKPTLYTSLDESMYKISNLIPLRTPFMYITEEEIMAYATFRYPELSEITCPYAQYEQKYLHKLELRNLQKDHPEVLFSIIRATEEMGRLLDEPYSPCTLCGRPTLGELCEDCRRTNRIRSILQLRFM